MSITRQNLSVIIVSYKSENVIENCINSIDNEIEIDILIILIIIKFKKKIEKNIKMLECILSKEKFRDGWKNNLGINKIQIKILH